MKYLLILITCFIFLCTNSLDPEKTVIEVSAGEDITVTKNDTINFSGIYRSTGDIKLFSWFIAGDNARYIRANTQQFQYIAPDSACTLSFIFRVQTVDNHVAEDTVIAYVVPDTILIVNAGQDQIVLAELPVVLHATYTADSISNMFWKIGSNKFIPSSPETTFIAPKIPLLLPCIFKVVNSDGIEAVDTVNINVISLDSLRVIANAGNDTSAVAGSRMTLHGMYKGKNITHTFWKIGNSDFIPASLDTTITLPDTPTTIMCVLKVKNAYLEVSDTVKITVLGNFALSAIAFKDTTIQAGSQLKMHGSYTGNVFKTFWKIGSSPFIQSPPETTITVPDTAMSLICILKVQDMKLNEALDTAVVTVIDSNAVFAQVGNDTTILVNSSLKIRGSFTGNVVGTFWKIGANNFIPASPETTITVPSAPVLLPCIFKVVGAESVSDEDTLIVNVVLLNDTVEAYAGKDIVAPVNSSVKFNGSYTGTNVMKTYWNINNSGFVLSSPDTTIKTPSSPAVWMCIFKVVTINLKVDLDTMYLTTVTTTVQADAGDDQHVAFDSTVQLKGTGKDTVNPNNGIVKFEWKYGNGLWIQSTDGMGVYNPPNIAGPIICSLRVTAMDGQTATDFCIINVISSIEMVLIPSKGKTFQMGQEYNSKASPVHNVKFTKNFFMSKTEITQKEFVSMLNMNPSPIKNDNYPVYNCNWFDAVYYCNARSKSENRDTVYSYSLIGGTIGYQCFMKDVRIDYTKKGYRLPTESEWEFACRAGSSTKFYWGTAVNGSYLWYRNNSQSRPRPVGSKLPNAFGLYDMSGNVKEWCNDWFDTYTAVDKVDPTGPDRSNPYLRRVVRNGSYYDVADSSSSYSRSNLEPNKLSTKTGFRVVIEE